MIIGFVAVIIIIILQNQQQWQLYIWVLSGKNPATVNVPSSYYIAGYLPVHLEIVFLFPIDSVSLNKAYNHSFLFFIFKVIF